jgi:hypothetical protein
MNNAIAASNGSLNGTSNGQSTKDHNGRGGSHKQEHEAEPSQLDLDYSPGLKESSMKISSHVFAQVEVERDRLQSDPRPPTLDPDERLRRRLNDESIVEM